MKRLNRYIKESIFDDQDVGDSDILLDAINNIFSRYDGKFILTCRPDGILDIEQPRVSLMHPIIDKDIIERISEVWKDFHGIHTNRGITFIGIQINKHMDTIENDNGTLTLDKCRGLKGVTLVSGYVIDLNNSRDISGVRAIADTWIYVQCKKNVKIQSAYLHSETVSILNFDTLDLKGTDIRANDLNISSKTALNYIAGVPMEHNMDIDKFRLMCVGSIDPDSILRLTTQTFGPDAFNKFDPGKALGLGHLQADTVTFHENLVIQAEFFRGSALDTSKLKQAHVFDCSNGWRVYLS